ncbi:SPASM domain-containing protein [Humidesulfovibrio sp.]|uniref:SPASM domain-containing protein n=1 Tax=Humidesulfovibrio sp. TaxID=2910988 RepID=UPI00280BC6D6|nr:SPASM domain-containing protein [Humidesulfovibrio sp.]
MNLRNTLNSLTNTWRSLGATPLFQTLELETFSPCNLKCKTCPNQIHRRSRQELPLDVIEPMIQELMALGYSGCFSPHFYNEPLLDPRLPVILRLVHQSLPKTKIKLFTNFTLMTLELYRTLLPLVDSFIVTVDQPEVQAAVDKLTPKLSPKELTKLHLRSIVASGLSNRAGALPLDGPVRAMRQCSFVNNMTVDAWGEVHLCCNDYFGKATFGNVKARALASIWHDPDYVQARRLGSRAAHALCRDCCWLD